jgi:hypothetical protein
MEDRIKLKRIIRGGLTYTTGDAQDWTYEYTWEDFEESLKNTKHDVRLMNTIYEHFREHPETLLKDGIYLGKRYTTERIQRWIEGNKNGHMATLPGWS